MRVEDLMGRDYGEQRRLVLKAAADERLVEAVLREAIALRSRDPDRARDWCHLAVLAARRLPGSRARDLLPQSLANLGNAHRVLRDFERAGELLREADLLAREAAPLIQAEIASLYASYFTDVRNLAAADARLRRAEELTARWGSRHDLGRLKIYRAFVENTRGRARVSVELLTEAIQELEGERAPLLMLMAVHNLAWSLLDLGESDEAREIYGRVSAAAYRKFGGRTGEVQRTWLLARILLAEKSFSKAYACLQEVSELHSSIASPLDQALLELDLVEATLGIGKAEEACSRARLAKNLCKGMELAPEAVVASRVLDCFPEKAARGEDLSAPLWLLKKSLKRQSYPLGSQP